MKGINDLPIDLWPIIFSNLTIKDLLNCRLVNKIFKYFSDHSNHINKLMILDKSKFYNYWDQWSLNYKIINEDEIIDLIFYKKIKSLLLFNLNKNLKYLKINLLLPINLESILSNLINLKALEINDSNVLINYKKELNLNNLEYFCLIDTRDNNYLTYELITPKLKKLHINYLNKINIQNQESIKHLITLDYNDQLDQFKNLEIIEFKNLIQLNHNLLSNFKMLKQLKIWKFGGINQLSTTIKNNLKEIINKRIILKRSIDIYLEGIKILDNNLLNELNLIMKFQTSLQYQIKNYDQLDSNLDQIKYLNFNNLNNYLTNIKHNLPISFFDKFFNLLEIRINDQVNEIDLIWFLNNIKQLISLKFSNVSFNKSFYSNLPIKIQKLKIIKSKLNLDYNFVFRLIKLRIFIIDKYFSSIDDLFSNLKYLNNHRFILNESKLEIIRDGEYYDLKLNYNTYKKRLNHLQLIINLIEIMNRIEF